MRIDDKYHIPKDKKPETRAEILQAKIEELVKKRDAETDPVAKQTLHAQILKLFAQYEGLRL
jgi:hypothetical protein